MANLKTNYIFNASYQVFTLIVPLIVTPYLSRVLGAEGIGLYSYTESIASYFVLVAVLGSTTYGQREISYWQDDIDRRSIVFWNVLTLRFILGLCVLLIYFVFCFLFSNGSLLELIFSISIVNVIVDITWFFQGMEEFKKIAIRNFFIKTLSTILIFVLIRSESDLCLYAIVMLGSNMLGYFALWPMLRGRIRCPKLSELKPFGDIGTVLSLFVPTIAISISLMLDKTMIGLLTVGSSENGYYEQAMKISRTALALVTALPTVMIPRIGYYFAKNDQKSINRYMIASYKLVSMLSIPLCLGLCSISSNFVPWFLGEEFLRSISVLSISSFLIVVIGFSTVTGMQYLVSTKRQHLYTASLFAGLFLNIVLNLILIPWYGAVGAAIASVGSELMICIIQFWFIRKELTFFSISKSCWKYLASGIVMCLTLSVMSTYLLPSISNTLLLVITGLVEYVLLLAVLKDQMFLRFSRAVIQKISGTCK